MPLRVLAGSRRGGSGVRIPGRDDAVPAPASRRRVFQITLGVIWLLDAALQFQPYMFTRAFVRDVILPAASGNPAIVGRPIIWSGDLMLRHVVIINAAFATVQLLLAAGLFWRPAVRLALAASITWSLAVWWLGEGLGGVLTGALDPFGGAPGAVLLYVVLALIVWPPRSAGEPGVAPTSVAESGLLSAQAARAVWVVLWAGLGCAALLPATRSADALSGTLSGLRDGEPRWIRAFDTALSNALAGHGAQAAVVFAVLCFVAGATVAAGRLGRLGVIAAIVAGVGIWVAQDFGELLTGQSTDPNSGALLIVIAAAFWPAPALARRERTDSATWLVAPEPARPGSLR